MVVQVVNHPKKVGNKMLKTTNQFFYWPLDTSKKTHAPYPMKIEFVNLGGELLTGSAALELILKPMPK